MMCRHPLRYRCRSEIIRMHPAYYSGRSEAISPHRRPKVVRRMRPDAAEIEIRFAPPKHEIGIECEFELSESSPRAMILPLLCTCNFHSPSSLVSVHLNGMRQNQHVSLLGYLPFRFPLYPDPLLAPPPAHFPAPPLLKWEVVAFVSAFPLLALHSPTLKEIH